LIIIIRISSSLEIPIIYQGLDACLLNYCTWQLDNPYLPAFTGSQEGIEDGSNPITIIAVLSGVYIISNFYTWQYLIDDSMLNPLRYILN
jgi:hypothetical protein